MNFFPLILLFWCGSTMALLNPAIVWQQPSIDPTNLRTAGNYQFAAPTSSAAIIPTIGTTVEYIVGVEYVESNDVNVIVSRSVESGQLLWSYQTNFSFNDADWFPPAAIMSTSSKNSEVLIYINIIEFSFYYAYFQTLSIPHNGTSLNKCSLGMQTPPPILNTLNGDVYFYTSSSEDRTVHRYAGSRDLCVPLVSSKPIPTTNNQYDSGAPGLSISSTGLTVMLNTNEEMLTLMRFDPTNLSVIWEREIKPPLRYQSCTPSKETPNGNNILLSDQNDVYLHYTCKDNARNKAIVKIDGDTSEVLGFLVMSIPESYSSNYLQSLGFLQRDSLQTPCFGMTDGGLLNFSCMSGSWDVYLSAEKFQSNLAHPFQGNYLWQIEQGDSGSFLVGYSGAGFSKTPPVSTFQISIADLPSISAVTFLPAHISPTGTALVLASYPGGLSLLRAIEREQKID